MAGVESEYIPWAEAVKLIKRLHEDQNYKMCLIVAFGCFLGLKMGEILSLKWIDILERDNLRFEMDSEESRRKTAKIMDLAIVPDLRKLVESAYHNMNIVDKNEFVFMNQKTRQVYTSQNINQLIKSLGEKYNISVKNLTTHSFRKTFGRHYWELDKCSEKSLTQLKEYFGHQRPGQTMLYLGINPGELRSSNQNFKLS